MDSNSTVPGQTARTGMSKGAKVTLIVVSVVVILIAITLGVIWAKKDALMKVGGNMMVLQIKKSLNDNPVEGIDTVMVNNVADAFTAKLDETELDAERFGFFFQQLTDIVGDEQVDSIEAAQFVQSMIDYFPELEGIVPTQPVDGADIPIDSTDSM